MNHPSLQLVRPLAVVIGALGVLGLFVSGHLFQLMNTDMAIDALRIVLAAYLVYVGFFAKNEHMASRALLVVGVLYVGMAVIGLLSPTLGGLLPSGLTGFDVIFHLVTGLAAILVGAYKGAHLPAHS